MSGRVRIKDIGLHGNQPLAEIDADELIPLPPPYDNPGGTIQELKPDAAERMVCNLDGVVALSLPHPESPEAERALVDQFAEGLKKLFTRENNWSFLQPLTLAMEYCVGCQTCSDACHVFKASGQEIYRPTYRSEVWRRLVKKYAKPGGKLMAPLTGADVDLNWTTVSRLYELAYRCNLCRRCAQVCPIGVESFPSLVQGLAYQDY